MVFDACSALCEGFVCWLKCLEGFDGLVLPMQLSLFLLDSWAVGLRKCRLRGFKFKAPLCSDRHAHEP